MIFMSISLVVVLEIKLGFGSAEFISERKGISTDVIYKAFSATEEGFLFLVKKKKNGLVSLSLQQLFHAVWLGLFVRECCMFQMSEILVQC